MVGVEWFQGWLIVCPYIASLYDPHLHHRRHWLQGRWGVRLPASTATSLSMSFTRWWWWLSLLGRLSLTHPLLSPQFRQMRSISKETGLGAGTFSYHQSLYASIHIHENKNNTHIDNDPKRAELLPLGCKTMCPGLKSCVLLYRT